MIEDYRYLVTIWACMNKDIHEITLHEIHVLHCILLTKTVTDKIHSLRLIAIRHCTVCKIIGMHFECSTCYFYGIM